MSKNLHVSQRAGKNPDVRTQGPLPIRGQRAQSKAVAAVFPTAMGAVDLGKRTGFQIEKFSNPEKFQKIYEGISRSYRRIKNGPRIDRKKEDTAQLFDIVTNAQKMVQEKTHVIIQEIQDDWVITIFKDAAWDFGWACFAVGKVINDLQRNDQFLLEVFLEFLKTFSIKTGTDLWYQGIFGESIERLDDELLNSQDEYGEDSKEVRELYKTLELYNHGLPHIYEQNLKYRGPQIDLDWFITSLEAYPKHPIAGIIREGVEIMRQNKRVMDYQMYHNDIHNDYFLPLNMGFSIGWAMNDAIWTNAEESLDGYAQEGVEEPRRYLAIVRGVKVENLDLFKEPDTFISDLQDFFDRTFNTLQKFKKYAY